MFPPHASGATHASPLKLSALPLQEQELPKKLSTATASAMLSQPALERQLLNVGEVYFVSPEHELQRVPPPWETPL